MDSYAGVISMSMILLKKQNHVYTQWEKFIHTGLECKVDVRLPILESWKRCYSLGIDPYNTEIHSSLDEQRIRKVRKEKENLIQVAKPFMANLYKFVKGSGFVVVLTDENGHIMELFGDKYQKQKPLTRNFFIGSNWSEREAGTNAIGTALVMKKPVQVSGPEHYCQKHHCLTCSAAPIFDNSGNLIAILDISGPSSASHLHTLGMVVAAAEAIMAQLRIQHKNNELAVVNKRLTNFFKTVSDGVIIVGKDGKVLELNPAAQVLLGRSEKNIIGVPASELFEFRSPLKGKKFSLNEHFTDVDIMVENKEGVSYYLASWEPIINERGEVTGGVFIIRPINQVQNLVNRLSGHSATMEFKDIIGQSPEIREAIRLAKLTAASTSSVLLQGESGTGKEIFAQAIHNSSLRSNGPFVAVNCGAIPRELIGSELFGYEEGAFTGAKRGGKPGKFELADGGTLFLDEIGDMPFEQQTALLRVLQEKKVARIGSTRMTPVNVRLICATNKNLRQEVEKGTFREDLFYRLNVITITIPPLRQRREDVPLLFNHFLEKLSSDWNCTFQVGPGVMECLIKYKWPGNVRELQNVVERVAHFAENGLITVKNLPLEMRETSITGSESTETLYSLPNNREERKKQVMEREKQQLLALLNKHGGNISKVAREMGVSRKTIYNKMRLYSIKN